MQGEVRTGLLDVVAFDGEDVEITRLQQAVGNLERDELKFTTSLMITDLDGACSVAVVDTLAVYFLPLR